MTARLTAVLVAVMLLVAVLGAAAGCSSSGSGTHALDGSAWRLTGWTLSSLDPNNFTITAKFADGKISGNSAVNSYGGPYVTGSGNAFSVGSLAVTEMAGPGPNMRAEQAYLTLLGQARSFKRSGDRLTLYDQHGNESLIFQAVKA